MASEVGVYDTDPANVALKVYFPPFCFILYSNINIIIVLQSRLKPGRMLLVDTKEKRIIQDVQLKLDIARSRPHSDWLREQVFNIVYFYYYLNLI